MSGNIWISTSDRLPEVGRKIVFYNRVSKEFHVGEMEKPLWQGGNPVWWTEEGWCAHEQIAYWMQLPDLP